MVNTIYLLSFVKTPRKFIIAELSIRKLGSSSVLIIILLVILVVLLGFTHVIRLALGGQAKCEHGYRIELITCHSY